MKVVAYLRVSTHTQASSGLGLEMQEKAVRTWARMAGHRIVEVYTDSGVSGSVGLERREALMAAMIALERGQAQGLVVYRLDRLSRELVTQEQLLAEVWRMGGILFSTLAGEQDLLGEENNDDALRSLFRHMVGAVAQYEGALIRTRLRLGRQHKAANGGYAGGRPPFGWVPSGGELVPDQREQEVIHAVRDLREQGNSLREIASELEKRGTPTKSGGTHWHATQVERLLSRASHNPIANRA